MLTFHGRLAANCRVVPPDSAFAAGAQPPRNLHLLLVDSALLRGPFSVRNSHNMRFLEATQHAHFGNWGCALLPFPAPTPVASTRQTAAAPTPYNTHPALRLPAGSLELDLLSVGSGCSGNLLARCLPSYRIAISSSCTVTVAPLTARATHVPSLWSTYAAGAYTQLSQCPTSAGAAVATSSSPTAAQVRAAIQTALERHVYGADNPLSASSVVWNTGTLTVTTAYDACSLRYGITDVSCRLRAGRRRVCVLVGFVG